MLFPPILSFRSTKFPRFIIFLIFLFDFPQYFTFSIPPKNDNKLRQKRFVLTGNKWASTDLTWKLHSDNLEEMDIFIISIFRNILHRAFAIWEEASASMLNFTEFIGGGKAKIDINIHFLIGEHGDGMPFDGREGKIAHAFYPPIGELHLDAEEKWTLNREDGTNLFETFVHEIGHLLGLGHSMDQKAVMFPIKKKFNGRIELAKDDLDAIRELYG